MVTPHFECKCGEQFEKFRFGLDNLKKFEQGKLKVECPKCKSTEVKKIIPKGSGFFKMR